MSNLDFHPRAKLTDSIDISTLESMRNQGMTNKQIAESLGVSKATISNYLPRLRNKIGRVDDETRQEIARLYLQKKTASEIATMFGIQEVTVYRILREQCVDTQNSKSKRRMPEKIKNDILNYREHGWTLKKISEATGFRTDSISRFLRRNRIANAPTRLDGTPDIQVVEKEEKCETLQEQLQKLIDNGQATVNEEGVMVPVDIPSKKVLKIENKTVQINGEYFSFSVDNDSVIAVAIDEEQNRRDCLYIPKSKIRDVISELTELADMIERGDV